MSANPDRLIPTSRVAAFVDAYCGRQYNAADDMAPTIDTFAAEVGLPARTVYRIRAGETTNTRFDLVDLILTRLDCIHLWHIGPEDGGFSDFYGDDPPAPAERSAKNRRAGVVACGKKLARVHGTEWMDEVHRRALKDDELRVAA